MNRETNSVSVLISTYNGEDYIIEQLESLLNQTRSIDEVVIVDDCSTDRTVEVVRSFIDKNQLTDQWKVFENEVNKGWRRNFMDGVLMTSGNIVLFSDQDDYWFKHKVERHMNIFDEHPEINVTGSPLIFWDGKNREEKLISDEYDVICLADNPDKYLIQALGCTMGFRKEYFMSHLKYHFENWAHDDFLWKLSIADGSCAYLKEPCIYHRVHGNNASLKRRNLKERQEACIRAISTAEQLEKCVIDEKNKNYEKNMNIISHKKNGEQTRLAFLKTGNPFQLMKLVFKYSDVYARRRQIIMDMIFTYKLDMFIKR